MTLDAIKAAIAGLPADQQARLTQWLVERDWAQWDAEIERDFTPGSRGTALLAKIEKEIADGRTRPIEEGFAERHKSRT